MVAQLSAKELAELTKTMSPERVYAHRMNKAIEDGSYLQVKGLIGEAKAAGIKSVADGIEMYRPLHHAVRRGDNDIVKLLLDNGAWIDRQDSSGNTALIIAVSEGSKKHLDIAKELINRNADCSIFDSQYRTPLHLAVNNMPEIIDTLLARKVKPNPHDEDGQTPLMYSVTKPALDIADKLLANGADIESQDNRGNTPLMLAASHGEVNSVKFLVGKDANIHAVNHSFQSPTTYALDIYQHTSQGTRKKYYDIARILLDEGESLSPEYAKLFLVAAMREEISTYKRKILRSVLSS